MELDDPAAEELRGSIAAVVDSNLAGPAALLAAFTEVQQELDAAGGAGGHLAAWLSVEHSLQETEAEIERLLQVRHFCMLPVGICLLTFGTGRVNVLVCVALSYIPIMHGLS